MPATPRVTVLGSMNMDISVSVPELPRPGATVLGSAAQFAPGGKGGNQAVAAARLGAEVRMAGCVGADDFGVRLLEALDAESVDTSAVRQVSGTASGLALIPVDPSGENMVTVAVGANETVGDEEVRSAFAHPVDVLIISAEIPAPAINAALSQAREALHAGALICLLNLAPVPPRVGDMLAAGVDWLVVNEIEAAAVLGHPVSGLADAAAAAGDLLAAGAARAVVTAGAAGAAYAGPDGTVTVPGFPVRAVDSVGAGDTFVGALATTIGAGADPESAVRAASAAAAVATTRRGTQAAMPRPAELTALTGI
ncbi:MAG TPA: ribokinase, partial [Streptosporangiaceae bacterium]|nr:ribokinase [Streptosporangiaceae bacterium]